MGDDGGLETGREPADEFEMGGSAIYENNLAWPDQAAGDGSQLCLLIRCQITARIKISSAWRDGQGTAMDAGEPAIGGQFTEIAADCILGKGEFAAYVLGYNSSSFSKNFKKIGFFAVL